MTKLPQKTNQYKLRRVFDPSPQKNNNILLKALFKKISLKKNLSCMVLNGISVFW